MGDYSYLCRRMSTRLYPTAVIRRYMENFEEILSKGLIIFDFRDELEEAGATFIIDRIEDLIEIVNKG